MSTAAVIAEQIAAARQGGRLLESGCFPELVDERTAWAVQRAGQALRDPTGAQLLGWKLGYTSQVMRAQMGVEAPNYGPLYTWMLRNSGDSAGEALVHPRTEPEIAVVMGAALAAADLEGLTSEGERRQAVASRVSAYRCALEVVDTVWKGYQFTWAENTADGSSAACVVLGPAIPSAVDVAAVGVELQQLPKTGDPAPPDRGSADAAMGHPLSAIAWLVEQLSHQDRALRADDLVITGGLTRAAPLDNGMTATARFSAPGWTGEVEVTR